MNEATSLSSATDRLERGDATLTSIDLRGKGRTRARANNVPRSTILRFAAGLKHHCRPPPALPSSGSCVLTYLALHNHLLDRRELPLLFDALPSVSGLETLVIFHHDVGDAGVEMLMQALTTEGQSISGYAQRPEMGLKELYLSHCGISCKGALAIAGTLNRSSSASDGYRKLTNLQVLSLGSNRIKEEGAAALAGAFGRYASLQRMVLHGNKGLDSSEHNNMSERKLYHHAIDPSGWQSQTTKHLPTIDLNSSTPTNLAMANFAPLILPHIRRRWENDRVLVRPHDTLRQRLREEMYRRDSTFVDSRLECMPDILAWMAREGACCRQTGLHSTSISFQSKGIDHSSGMEEHCRACAAIHLNDLHELLLRMPHLVALLRSLSARATAISCNATTEELTICATRLAL